MSYLSRLFEQIRELVKTMEIIDTQMCIITIKPVRKWLYKVMGQSIKRLVISTTVFYFGTLPYKYLCHSIIRHFILVIPMDYKQNLWTSL